MWRENTSVNHCSKRRYCKRITLAMSLCCHPEKYQVKLKFILLLKLLYGHDFKRLYDVPIWKSEVKWTLEVSRKVLAPSLFFCLLLLLLLMLETWSWTQWTCGQNCDRSFEICSLASELFDPVTSCVKMLFERSDKWQYNEKMKAVPACLAFSSTTTVPILGRPLKHKDQHVHKQNSSCTVIKKIYKIYHAWLKHKRKPVRYGNTPLRPHFINRTGYLFSLQIISSYWHINYFHLRQTQTKDKIPAPIKRV